MNECLLMPMGFTGGREFLLEKALDETSAILVNEVG